MHEEITTVRRLLELCQQTLAKNPDAQFFVTYDSKLVANQPSAWDICRVNDGPWELILHLD